MTTAPERKKRATWTHADVAALVKRAHDPNARPAEQLAPLGDHDAADVKAKMLELGLIDKPEKTVLTNEDCAAVDAILADHFECETERGVLRTRYAATKLRESLPKRGDAK